MPGFTSGFAGGVALALGLSYLSVVSHTRNRQVQALHLRTQTQFLTSLLDNNSLPPPLSRAEIARQSRSTFVEAAKDRWNREVENGIRWLQTTDWISLRENMEGAVTRLLGGRLQESQEVIEEAEQKAGPKIQESADGSEAAEKKANTTGIASAEGASGTIETGTSQANAPIKDGLNYVDFEAQEITSEVKTSTDHSLENIHGTTDKARIEVYDAVNSSRNVVRNVINKGMENGKEIIDQAQNAVGLEKNPQSRTLAKMPGMSEVEKALHRRYGKMSRPDKTVEEALEERYKPIDQRGDAVLRGL